MTRCLRLAGLTALALTLCQLAAAQAWQSEAVFLSDARLETLRQRIAEKTDPNYSAWLELQAECDANLDHQPDPVETWDIPPRYDSPSASSAARGGLFADAKFAYKFALCYRMTDEARYAEAAVRQLDAWMSTLTTVVEDAYTDQSKLAMSDGFPSMIFAADLLADFEGWPETKQAAFKTFIREKILPMNSMASQNNHGNWGLVLVAAAATYLDDKELFDEAVYRWKFFVHSQIADDGRMWFEVKRHRGEGERGVHYSHFALLPQTIAAEILRVNGQDLYDWVSPSGRTLKQAFDKIAHWTRHPEEFPFYEGDPAEMRGNPTNVAYFEVLNERWPNEDATALLKELRPLSGSHVAFDMTFTHGEPLGE